MRGLIEKDIRLLLQRKKAMALLAGMAVFLSVGMDDSFVTSYLSMVGMVLAVSTISYDEFDNGHPFMFTLPISRKGYAAEKLLFGSGCIILCWLCGVVIQCIVSTITGKGLDFASFLSGAFIYLAVFLIMLSVLVPVELYFGMEKARVAMVVIFGGCFAAGMLGPKLANALKLDITPVIENLKSLPKGGLIGGGVTLTLAIMALSCLIAIRVMEKKEF